MCTFDIVPSLGPQSQVLNIAEVSVLVQSAFRQHGSRSAPITGITSSTPLLMFSQEWSRTRHRCSSPITGAAQDCAQQTIPSSRSEDRRKGSLAPAITLITNFYMWWQLQASQDYHNMDSHTQISLIVTIASNNSIFK